LACANAARTAYPTSFRPIVGDNGEARANVLLRYRYIEADLRLVLQTLRQRVPALRHIDSSVSFALRINDPVRGEHDYLSMLTDEVAVLIEKWYRDDFALLGFRRRSRTRVRTVLRGKDKKWLSQACAPVTAMPTADPPVFDVADWPAPLACRTTAPKRLGTAERTL
jgi:hypothetical protein